MEQLVSVVIRGEQYTIRSTEDPAYVQRVAAYVDEKLHGVMKGSKSLPPTKATVLASLNITDELFKAKTERERLEGSVAVKLNTLAELLGTVLEERARSPKGDHRGLDGYGEEAE